MAGYKSARMAEDIKREISRMVQELKDPRIQKGMVSIVRVEVSRDCSYARVYVSAMGGMKEAELAVKGLQSALGYIKRELSNCLHLRKSPEIKLIPDDSMEYSAHLEKIFLDLDQKKNTQQGNE